MFDPLCIILYNGLFCFLNEAKRSMQDHTIYYADLDSYLDSLSPDVIKAGDMAFASEIFLPIIIFPCENCSKE